MFRIGEFSRFSRVSVKMLRHYDELGLLVPAHVDPATGYRYYTADQLPRVSRIVALRDLGFGLEQIGRLLDEDLPAEQLRGMLKLRRAELAQQMENTAAQMALVETRLALLDRAGSPPTYDVILRPVASQTVATIRQPISTDDATVTALFEELEAYVARFKARAPLPPLMLTHVSAFPEQAEDIEIAVPINRPLPTDDRVAVRELPGHDTTACVVCTGGYEALPEAFAVLLGWLERHRYRAVGPTREVYLRFGADQVGYTLPEGYIAESSDAFVTELQIPVTKE